MDNNKTAGHINNNEIAGSSGSSCSCTPKSDAQPCNCLTENISRFSAISTIKNTPSPEIRTTASTLTLANRLDHFLARWGVNRMGHIVKPGLYRLGNPTPDSLVFVSANYTLSFDAVRTALAGTDCYIQFWTQRGLMSGALQVRAHSVQRNLCGV